MTTEIFLIILLVIAVAYLNSRVNKMSNSMTWLLKHVHVVSKSQELDPELKIIKNTFGIEEDQDN